jgi:hypothetical protein
MQTQSKTLSTFTLFVKNRQAVSLAPQIASGSANYVRVW